MQLSYLKNTATLKFDTDRCVGCGICLEVCPRRVFEKIDGKARIRDRDACMECGACALNCPARALTVNANVGCASAIIKSWFNGGKVSCDCGTADCC